MARGSQKRKEESATDKKQIGLTAAGGLALDQLMEAGIFASETDAYRVGITYSLAKELDPSKAPEGGYQTKFNAAGGLDVYQEIRDLIEILRPQDSGHPYATAERLAELGITALAERMSEQESLADILAEFDDQVAIESTTVESTSPVDSSQGR